MFWRWETGSQDSGFRLQVGEVTWLFQDQRRLLWPWLGRGVVPTTSEMVRPGKYWNEHCEMILSSEETAAHLCFASKYSMIFIQHKHRMGKEAQRGSHFLTRVTAFLLAHGSSWGTERPETNLKTIIFELRLMREPYISRERSQPCLLCLHKAEEVGGKKYYLYFTEKFSNLLRVNPVRQKMGFACRPTYFFLSPCPPLLY